jgi:hypothetical protein
MTLITQQISWLLSIEPINPHLMLVLNTHHPILDTRSDFSILVLP